MRRGSGKEGGGLVKRGGLVCRGDSRKGVKETKTDEKGASGQRGVNILGPA